MINILSINFNTDSPGEIKYQLKFLVDNNCAGLVIGKGGANIKQFQEESGATIKLSQTGNFFPGTNKRVIMVTASNIERVIHAVSSVCTKIFEGISTPEQQARGLLPPSELKLAVPNAAAGIIIGKGGENIKKIINVSEAKINLVGREVMPPGVDERFVIIQGTLDQQLAGARMVVEQMSEDPNAFSYSNSNTNYPPGPGGNPGFDDYYGRGPAPGGPGGYSGGGGGAGGRPPAPYGYGSGPSHSAPPAAGGRSSTVQVPDHLVGALVGKMGATIKELMAASGCTIKISQKGEYMVGTTNRIVTISSGDEAAIERAQQMINEKLQAAEARNSGGGGGGGGDKGGHSTAAAYGYNPSAGGYAYPPPQPAYGAPAPYGYDPYGYGAPPAPYGYPGGYGAPGSYPTSGAPPPSGYSAANGSAPPAGSYGGPGSSSAPYGSAPHSSSSNYGYPPSHSSAPTSGPPGLNPYFMLYHLLSPLFLFYNCVYLLLFWLFTLSYHIPFIYFSISITLPVLQKKQIASLFNYQITQYLRIPHLLRPTMPCTCPCTCPFPPNKPILSTTPPLSRPRRPRPLNYLFQPIAKALKVFVDES